MKNKTIKVLIYVLSVYLLTLLQTNWTLWEYRLSTSSSCLDCDLFSDAVILSIFPAFFSFLLLFLFLRLKTKATIQISLTVLFLFIFWTAITTSIFEDRVASWSTFTHTWLIGLNLTLLPGIISGIALSFVYSYLFTRNHIEHQ